MEWYAILTLWPKSEIIKLLEDPGEEELLRQLSPLFALLTPAERTGSKMATDQRIATLQGKISGITGTAELYKGKPEIKVVGEAIEGGIRSLLRSKKTFSHP